MSNIDVGFRRIRDSDLQTLRAWRNSPEISQAMYSEHHITEEEHKAWFLALRQDASKSYWIIELDGRAVGLANVINIDFQDRSAEWAFYLADASTRGKGVGLYVEYCVLACVFDYWNLEALNCEVLETNAGVSAMHESVGFVQTDRLVGRVMKNGKPVDALAYVMKKDDWVSARRHQLEERIRAKGREPAPLLSILESREAEADQSGADQSEGLTDRMSSEIAKKRVSNLQV